jgi:hypothetical protein
MVKVPKDPYGDDDDGAPHIDRSQATLAPETDPAVFPTNLDVSHFVDCAPALMVVDRPANAAAPPGAPKINGADTAVEFLERLRPGGPWVLTAIGPLDETIETITAFTPDDVHDFINVNNGQRNLYYTVNPTRRAMTSKPAKIDIAAIEYLLGDLDPRDDETSEAAKARYLEALEREYPATEVIDSGNGLQALWKLAEPIDISQHLPVKGKDGNPILAPEAAAIVADAEARSAALMQRLGSKAERRTSIASCACRARPTCRTRRS